MAREEGWTYEFEWQAPLPSKDGKRLLKRKLKMIWVGGYCRCACDECGKVTRIIRVGLFYFEENHLENEAAGRRTRSDRAHKYGVFCRSCEMRFKNFSVKFDHVYENNQLMKKIILMAREKEKIDVTT